MSVPAWPTEYIGLPFRIGGRDRDGIDCWGLVRLVLAERFGLALPSYADEEAYPAAANDREAIAALIAGVRGRAETGGLPGWACVWRAGLDLGLEDRLPACAPADLLLFRTGRLPGHVGLALSARRFLHVESGSETTIAELDADPWRLRLLAVWRHRRLPAPAAAVAA